MIAELNRLLDPESATATEAKPSLSNENGEEHSLSYLTSGPAAKALHLSASNSSKKPLTTNTKFALSQLPALRALLAELRPKLASLQNATMNIHDAKAARREERREYIEQRAKLHLEKSAGSVSVDQRAGVAGRNMALEEVEALEEVAKKLNDG